MSRAAYAGGGLLLSTRTIRRWLVAALGVCVSFPGASARLAAQDRVRVVDGFGLPVPAARIEVYGRAELLHVLATGADGVASLPEERRGDVRRLSITHLGFRTLIVQAEDLVGRPTLRLDPEALAVEGLEVEVAGESCATGGSDEARALWAEVAASYSPDTGRRPLWASYLYGAGSVMEPGLHHVREAALGRRQGSRHPTPGSASSLGVLEAVIARQGYSWQPPPRQWGRRDLHRVYPSLEMWHAYHFATSTFGDRHDFHVLRSGPESTVLAFCPRSDAPGTRLMGTLELVRAVRFVHAEWRFLTEDPNENAGGEVDFAMHLEGARRLPHLLARRGLFYRHNGKDPPYPELPRAYYREAVAQVAWSVLPPGSRP